MVSVDCKNHARLLWWSKSKDSTLPMQRTGVQSLGREVLHTTWHSQKKQKQEQNQKTAMHLLWSHAGDMVVALVKPDFYCGEGCREEIMKTKMASQDSSRWWSALWRKYTEINVWEWKECFRCGVQGRPLWRGDIWASGQGVGQSKGLEEWSRQRIPWVQNLKEQAADSIKHSILQKQ